MMLQRDILDDKTMERLTKQDYLSVDVLQAYAIGH